MENFNYAQRLFNEIDRLKKTLDSIEKIEDGAERYLKNNGYHPKTTQKIAVMSQKGGVGKSTTAINLSLDLRLKTYGKVGLVELDIDDPNDKDYLDTEIIRLPGNNGNLSTILTKPEGKLEQKELQKMIKDGELMDFLNRNMAITNNPIIHALFSNLLSRVNKRQVYQKIFSLFNRVSAYNSKDGTKRFDYLIFDFPTGSMSDPKVNELMKYFDYRILMIGLDPICINGLYTAIQNDKKGEFTKQDATNILVTNKIPSDFIETRNLPLISRIDGKGMAEAKAVNKAIREELSSRLRIDYSVRILNISEVDQGRNSTETLRPAILTRNKEKYCRSIDALTKCIVDDAIKKTIYSGGK